MPNAMPSELFSAPTYIVLDLPSLAAEEVTALRARYDPYEANLPPEITVAGSSGAGTLAEAQSATDVFAALARIARRHAPFVCAFESMQRFPGVPVFWLKPRDRLPFDALHSALLESGVRFSSSPFVFTPHCTISATVELSKEQESELLCCSIPKKDFVLDKLSVYELVGGQARLLQSFPLGA
ncbi:2'-5' RNA ligase family protein [Polaromonas sp.]|uniref:2'-5' RNA ligase family protein n=1 Tax=Polaromonas sp. TaxID=1869339 RepID=UPI003CA7EA16